MTQQTALKKDLLSFPVGISNKINSPFFFDQHQISSFQCEPNSAAVHLVLLSFVL